MPLKGLQIKFLLWYSVQQYEEENVDWNVIHPEHFNKMIITFALFF